MNKKNKALNELYKTLFEYYFLNLYCKVSQKLNPGELDLITKFIEKIFDEIIKRAQNKNLGLEDLDLEFEMNIKELTKNFPEIHEKLYQALEEARKDVNQILVEFLKNNQT